MGSDVAMPLRAVAEAGHILAGRGPVDDLQHDIAAGSGAAADVFEHQQPGAEHEAEADPRVRTARAWRICSAVMAGGRP